MMFISHTQTLPVGCIGPILIRVSYKEGTGCREEESKRRGKKCLPDNLHMQLCISRGEEKGERATGGAGQRIEEQMHCGGRGGGPTAIVHVLP